MGNKDYSALLAQIVNALPMDDGAIHQSALADRIGISATALKQAIRQGRQQGLKILSSHKGYYLTEDPAKINRFLKTMKAQGIGRLSTISKIRQAIQGGADREQGETKTNE